MKLVTFEQNGARHIGVVTGKGIVDLSRAAPTLPSDMLGLINAWDDVSGAVAAAVAAESRHIPLEAVHLLAPIPRPGKVMAMALNYDKHIKESGWSNTNAQTWFAKMQTSVTGPYDNVERPLASEQVDYEAELVVVVGRRAKHLTVENALSCVFGYCVGNDVSVRDVQLATTQFVLGKSFDTHAPFGPWITTADEVGDAQALGLRCFVNGELRQNANTSEMVFNIAEMISNLSRHMTLEPGDVLFTGTCEGVGFAYKPPIFMKAGDRCRVEIDKLGAIENLIVNEEAR